MTTPRPSYLLRLLHLRLTLVACTLAAALLAHPLFEILVPPLPVILLAVGWLCGGFGLGLHFSGKGRFTTGDGLLLLLFDVILLSAMLMLSGGPANPLTALYLPLVASAAALLPRRLLWVVLGAAAMGYSALWIWSLPLTVEDAERAALVHLLGMWVTFMVSALLVGLPVARAMKALRAHERALSAARQATLAAERIAALGTLAAGAAHELGTPLNTMGLLADEIAISAQDEALDRLQLADDAAALKAQVSRCRDILDTLLADAGLARAGQTQTSLGRWAETQVKRFRLLAPQCSVRLDWATPEAAQMPVQIDPTLNQALLNLLQNAGEAAAEIGIAQEVTLEIQLAAEQLNLRVRDRGPGFSAEALAAAGRRVYSGKAQGMGMGLLLCAATAERLGGRFICQNRETGAETCLQLPLKALQ